MPCHERAMRKEKRNGTTHTQFLESCCVVVVFSLLFLLGRLHLVPSPSPSLQHPPLNVISYSRPSFLQLLLLLLLMSFFFFLLSFVSGSGSSGGSAREPTLLRLGMQWARIAATVGPFVGTMSPSSHLICRCRRVLNRSRRISARVDEELLSRSLDGERERQCVR